MKKESNKNYKQLEKEISLLREQISLLKKNESKFKKTEEALRESKKKYHNLFKTSVDGIMIIDAETSSIIDVNNACEEIYGYTKRKFLKLKLSDVSAEPEKSLSSIKPTLDGKLKKIPIR